MALRRTNGDDQHLGRRIRGVTGSEEVICNEYVIAICCCAIPTLYAVPVGDAPVQLLTDLGLHAKLCFCLFTCVLYPSRQVVGEEHVTLCLQTNLMLVGIGLLVSLAAYMCLARDDHRGSPRAE